MVCIVLQGTIFVADSGNARVRRIARGAVSTLAGCGEEATRDGVGAAAAIDCPQVHKSCSSS